MSNKNYYIIADKFSSCKNISTKILRSREEGIDMTQEYFKQEAEEKYWLEHASLSKLLPGTRRLLNEDSRVIHIFSLFVYYFIAFFREEMQIVRV